MRHLFDSPLGASPFNRGAPKNISPAFAAALPSIITGGANLLGGALNNIVNRSNMDKQVEASKQLAKFQWDNFTSYPAQVRSMLKAGLNPSVLLGQGGAGTTSSPSINMPTAAPVDLGLSTSLSEIGNFVKSMADAKKAGADTDKILAETDAIKLQYDLQKEFGQKSWILDLAQKYQNVILAKKTNDIKEQEKAINEYKKASEKALSESNGIQRDMLAKRLDNIDTEIRLSNKLSEEKINTEKSQQGALAASANASNASARLANAQASTEDALRDLKKFAIDLGNHMQGLEYGFNLDTYQTRLEKFANEAGIVKWTAFLNEIEAKDREAYNAVQRLIMGKGSKEDGKTLWNFINSGRQLIPFK